VARIVFHSAAYWGDVMPYVPIANELVARGHDVTFAVGTDFHEILGGERFVLADNGNPMSPQRLANDAGHEHLVERNGLRLGGALVGRYYVREWVVPYLRSGFDALVAAGEGADLFVTHPTAGIITRMASDALGIPFVTGHLFPMALETWARIPAPLRRVGGVAFYDGPINAFRREVGLEPIRPNATDAALHDGMLLLWSARFAPPQPRWPSSWRNTGFTLWDGPKGQSVDPDVEAWIDAGEPPVAVTFGTSAALVARKLFETVAVRLDDLGLRGLFLTGGADLLPSMQERPDVFRFAALTAVLPRCRAIVQSGSHGTNAAALTVGVPTVTVPSLIDQAWNGARNEALGLGVLVKGKRRRAERIWDALNAVTNDDGYAQRARAFAEQLAEEDGVRASCDAIERRVRT
jgi:UDP:flavonoid glycosyltransferase YjiC (YdhE family)